MNLKNALGVLLASLFTLSCIPVFAAKGFSYTYVDAGYEYVNGNEESYQLAAIDASFDTFEYVALRAGFRRGVIEDYEPAKQAGTSDPDFTEFQVGAQGHFTVVKKKLDLFTGATWFYNSINANDVSSVGDWGGIFDAGIRYQPFKRIEFDVAGRHREADSLNSDTTLTVGSVIRLTKKKIFLNLRTSQLGDDDIYFAGLRLGL